MIGQVQAHSAVVAQLATDFSSGQVFEQEAFVAGLLHDAGWLVFASQAPDLLQEYLTARRRGLPSSGEADILSASHAHVGAHLLSLWGIPSGIVDTVARHEDVVSTGQQLNFALVVRAADWAAEQAGSGLDVLEDPSEEPDLGFPEASPVKARLHSPVPAPDTEDDTSAVEAVANN